MKKKPDTPTPTDQPVKRLFIEVDQTNEHNEHELRSFMRSCRFLSSDVSDNFWWKVVDDARFKPDLFELITEADEIYMDTSLMPIIYGTSIGSPELWDKMMKLAVENNLTGKKVFINRLITEIEWQNLDKKLLKAAFKGNSLFVASEDYEKWEQVDIAKLTKRK